MAFAVAIFVISTAGCLALTPFAAAIAAGRGWIDMPQGPLKIHSSPVPRAGGLATWFVFWAAVAAGAAVAGTGGAGGAAAAGLFVAGTSALAAGVLDDARGACPWLRLSIETTGASCAVALGYRLPITGIVPLDAGLSVLLLVGFANAFNLIDGIDGLAAGLAALASAYLALLGAAAGDALSVLAGASLAGCSIGFMRYNFSEPKVFLGDGGSLFLGMTLSALAVRVGSASTGSRTELLVPFLLLAIPAIDTTYAVARRAINRRPLFIGDRSHLYDSMIRRGLAPRYTLLILLAVCLFSGIVTAGSRAGWARASAVGLTVSAAIWIAAQADRLRPERSGGPRRKE